MRTFYFRRGCDKTLITDEMDKKTDGCFGKPPAAMEATSLRTHWKWNYASRLTTVQESQTVTAFVGAPAGRDPQKTVHTSAGMQVPLWEIETSSCAAETHVNAEPESSSNMIFISFWMELIKILQQPKHQRPAGPGRHQGLNILLYFWGLEAAEPLSSRGRKVEREKKKKKRKLDGALRLRQIKQADSESPRLSEGLIRQVGKDSEWNVIKNGKMFNFQWALENLHSPEVWDWIIQSVFEWKRN